MGSAHKQDLALHHNRFNATWGPAAVPAPLRCLQSDSELGSLTVQEVKIMHKCENCELAVYCFSEPHTWVFRTKQEMEEKQAIIFGCTIYQQTQAEVSPLLQECAQASSRR